MNRLTQKIQEARKRSRKILCVYVTLGFTSMKVTEEILKELDDAGVDILELGFPFSDPLADGPTIQSASQYALRKPVRIEDALRIVSKSRKRGVRMPIIFFSYLNPIFRYGVKRFATDIKRAGFDGVIIPDLPPDEDPGLRQTIRQTGLSFVNLIAPTTTPERMRVLMQTSDDFVYYVSRRGVTGERRKFEFDLSKNLAMMKRLTKKPILVGFGISTPRQARIVAGRSDGVIVGSALISALKKKAGQTGPALWLARALGRAVHGGSLR